MALKDNLPSFVAEEKYTKEVLDAIEPEIYEIIRLLKQALLECSISTCSITGLLKYENDYGLLHKAELSIDERKDEVINKMLNKKRLTMEELKNLIKRNINRGQFYISNCPEQYKFKIMITQETYRQRLYNAVYRARPAYLIFDIEVVPDVRRCGTFTCDGYVV